jgi:hypothetical protein
LGCRRPDVVHNAGAAVPTFPAGGNPNGNSDTLPAGCAPIQFDGSIYETGWAHARRIIAPRSTYTNSQMYRKLCLSLAWRVWYFCVRQRAARLTVDAIFGLNRVHINAG